MASNIANEIKKLSVAERILLVEEIWDSIARENEAFELSDSQKKELERRSQSFSSNPALGRSWEEIKAEFLKSK
ncbi:MAG: addiction module protein [Ignavibacteriales bacterium]|nr:addiction module protein [Ignavibacteriales bacterium]